MKVYIDENNICHAEAAEGRTEAEHSFFDSVPELAISCYKFVPETGFIQCVDDRTASAIKKQYEASEEHYNQILYDIAVEIGAINE